MPEIIPPNPALYVDVLVPPRRSFKVEFENNSVVISTHLEDSFSSLRPQASGRVASSKDNIGVILSFSNPTKTLSDLPLVPPASVPCSGFIWKQAQISFRGFSTLCEDCCILYATKSQGSNGADICHRRRSDVFYLSHCILAFLVCCRSSIFDSSFTTFPVYTMIVAQRIPPLKVSPTF